MSIFKVAQSYRRFLALASQEAYQLVSDVRDAAKNLYKVKDLWMNAADPYSDTDVQEALDKINQYSEMYYDAAFNKGMTAQEHATFLNELDNSVSDLDHVHLSDPLDPTASHKAAELKASLEKARAGYVPTYLAPLNKKEEPTHHETVLDSGEGNAYTQEHGASPMALEGVVNMLENENNPPDVSHKVEWHDLDSE